MLLRILSFLFLLASPVWAGLPEGTPTNSGVTNTTPALDAYGTVMRPLGPIYAYKAVAADNQVKAGAGILHSVICQSDAAATAGSIILYDSLTETGTKIWEWTIAAQFYPPYPLVFDVAFATGLFVGYTTTADVLCTVTYQ